MNYELDEERLVKRFTAYAQINTASDECKKVYCLRTNKHRFR